MPAMAETDTGEQWQDRPFPRSKKPRAPRSTWLAAREYPQAIHYLWRNSLEGPRPEGRRAGRSLPSPADRASISGPPVEPGRPGDAAHTPGGSQARVGKGAPAQVSARKRGEAPTPDARVPPGAQASELGSPASSCHSG